MDKNIKIHPAQSHILKVLLFNPQARFAELNELRFSTDHFSFHIKSLMDAGLIVKTQNRYNLTIIGKEFAGRFDVDSAKVGLEKQAKISVAVAAVKKENGKTKYLLQKRLKQPYFGYQGFITGKIKWGETVLEAAGREFKETIEGGHNFWLTKKEILNLPNLFHSVKDVIEMVSQSDFVFSETKYTVSGY